MQKNLKSIIQQQSKKLKHAPSAKRTKQPHITLAAGLSRYPFLKFHLSPLLLQIILRIRMSPLSPAVNQHTKEQEKQDEDPDDRRDDRRADLEGLGGDVDLLELAVVDAAAAHQEPVGVDAVRGARHQGTVVLAVLDL